MVMRDKPQAQDPRVLGSVDHLLAFSVDPPGVLVLRRHWDGDDTWSTVIRADPQIEVSEQLLADFADGGDNNGMYPDAWLEPNYAHNLGECRIAGGKCFNGWLLHVDGRDRHVVYQISAYVPKRETWTARWPD